MGDSFDINIGDIVLFFHNGDPAEQLMASNGVTFCPAIVTNVFPDVELANLAIFPDTIGGPVVRTSVPYVAGEASPEGKAFFMMKEETGE